MMRLALLLKVLAVVTFGVFPALAQEASGPDLDLSIELEERAHPPFPGEMVLITIRGTYRLPITLEKLVQPALTGFDWMQLGEDRWIEELDAGQTIKIFERRMALFPRAAGRIEIGRFVHELDLLNRTGQRFFEEVRSQPLTIEIAELPEEEQAGNRRWWFPVRQIEVNDRWSNPPERLEAGGGAIRIITVTAQGVAPEMIPPMPKMRSAGLHVFPHPEKRIVTLGPNGPITRAFWRWTVRPEGASAGFLDPLTLDYFDTVARERREITISAQRVAYATSSGDALAPPFAEGATSAADRSRQAQEGVVTRGLHFLDASVPRLPPPAGLVAGLAIGALAGALLLPQARQSLHLRSAVIAATNADASRPRSGRLALALRRWRIRGRLRRLARHSDHAALLRAALKEEANWPGSAPLLAAATRERLKAIVFATPSRRDASTATPREIADKLIGPSR